MRKEAGATHRAVLYDIPILASCHCRLWCKIANWELITQIRIHSQLEGAECREYGIVWVLASWYGEVSILAVSCDMIRRWTCLSSTWASWTCNSDGTTYFSSLSLSNCTRPRESSVSFKDLEMIALVTRSAEMRLFCQSDSSLIDNWSLSILIWLMFGLITLFVIGRCQKSRDLQFGS